MNYIEELQKEEWFAKLPPSTQASIDITLQEVDRRARESNGEMVAEHLRDWDVHAMDDREFRALVRHYIKNNLTPNQ